ncbi:hypothetical protein [Litoribacter populi]|uniref:hypothetical protein n=1 Tax=Litoribacter populi TaxID=2598460 RepID=UPI00117C7FD0|nr:hypothetical protein [Litoribacter populi]
MKAIPNKKFFNFLSMITGIHITGGLRIYRKWLWLKGLLLGLLESVNLLHSDDYFFAKREVIC